MILDTYSTLSDKDNHFDSTTIDDKNSLDLLIDSMTGVNRNNDLVFRGVHDAKYKLFNSAQRFWNTEELDKLGSSYQDFIQKQIDKAKAFQNNLLVKFYNAFGHVAYDLSILSFLQHYNAPTPLLDFTKNFDCALFFGTDGLMHTPSTDIGNYFSIYSIDTRQREFISILTHIESSVSQINDILERNQNLEIDTTNVLNELELLKYSTFHNLTLFYLPGFVPGGIPFNIPNRPNFRLVYNQHNLNVINQEGLFVFNSDPTHPLEDYFSGRYGTDFQNTFRLNKIKCWNIHKSLKEYIVRYLTENRTIPIDREFIYPQEEFIASSAFKEFKNFK